MSVLTVAAGWVIVCFVGLLGLNFLIRVYWNNIDLKELISEVDGGASLSRLQFLIFTFVIALSLFLVIVGTPGGPKFPEVPASIVGLLGISGGSYLVSKGIQFSNPAGLGGPNPALVLSAAPSGPLAAGATANFTVTLLNVPAGTAIPSLTWSLDAPAHGTIATTAGGATYTAATPSPGPNTKVTIRVQSAGFEDGLAVVTLA